MLIVTPVLITTKQDLFDVAAVIAVAIALALAAWLGMNFVFDVVG